MTDALAHRLEANLVRPTQVPIRQEMQPRRLCRRHHRVKTTGRWRYLRTPEGDYDWHGPHDTTYLVTPRGTQRA